MATIDWLNERIGDGEALRHMLLELGAGPARRNGDLHGPELRDVRSFLSEFAKWDGGNLAELRRRFGKDSAWVEQYRGIQQVDRQLALTDFTPHKSRIESCLLGKLDELRSIRESVVRRFVPQGGKRACVFIGHGRSPAWRELDDYLSGTLGLGVRELERSPAAGLAIVDRLDEMLEHSQFAVMVMTADDQHRDDSAHARENVIHEIGLAQGRLGRARVVVLLEEGCNEFSNINGLVHVPFPRGRLNAAFEGVRGALEREGLIPGRTTAA